MDLQQTFQSLKDSLASAANVKTVYGEPLTIGAKTIIPVARVGYGFGAGSGKGKRAGGQDGEGGGGGGGVGAVPVGVVEVTPERTRFVAFGNRKKLLAPAAAGVLIGMMLRGRR